MAGSAEAPPEAPATSRPDAPPRGRRVDPGEAARTDLRATVATAVVTFAAIGSAFVLPPIVAGGAMLAVALLYLTRTLVFSWTGGLVALAAIVMLVPIRRYALPIPLPFALEPYRVVIVALIVAVGVALVVDPSFRWRPVRFGWPIGIFLTTMLASLWVNGAGLAEQGLVGGAIGAFVNLLLLLSVLFTTRQLLREERHVMLLLTFLVWAAAAVGFLALVEKATRVNVFLLLGNVLPLTLLREEGESLRAGGARAYASAQHPIALAVLLCMLIPIAIYLAKYAGWPRNEINRRIVYGIAVGMMLLGVVAAISRTAVIVLVVMFLLTLILRPQLAVALGLLALPLVLLGLVVQPKIFGEMIGSFFDVDSLIASQYTSAGWGGAGRLADLEPAMREASAFPFFGTGLGSRIVIGEDRNAYILDNQVLGTLLETGALGVIGLAVFVLTPPIMLLVFAFRSKAAPRHTFLAFAIAISCAGYTAALFFYDAFGFMQTFLVLCLLLACGAWLLTEAPDPTPAPAPAPAETRR
ncbi:O-antigen ligase [Agromyces sp. LHK192]|uniref:O-antigen ligase family protein n=1 Tax=Agromyces sp. LHK192 TaxID=2498704 RepID=UPI0013E36AC8|nr:O-antigen ligase family protein [Agromyces sp. LHK192]